MWHGRSRKSVSSPFEERGAPTGGVARPVLLGRQRPGHGVRPAACESGGGDGGEHPQRQPQRLAHTVVGRPQQRIEIPLAIAKDLRTMPSALFADAPIGLELTEEANG